MLGLERLDPWEEDCIALQNPERPLPRALSTC
jgi:hypothetical protein